MRSLDEAIDLSKMRLRRAYWGTEPPDEEEIKDIKWNMLHREQAQPVLKGDSHAENSV